MGVFRSRFLPDHDMTVKPNDFSIRPVQVDAPTDFSLIDRWFEHVQETAGWPSARGAAVNARDVPANPSGLITAGES